jgi:hypothetical protein
MAALIQEDRIKETTTTTGTGNVTLAGAVTGYRTFASVMANGDTCLYCIAAQSGSEWETGIGTFVSATPALARTTVLESSNAGSAVDFSAGTKDVFITLLGSRFTLPHYTSDPAAPSSGAWLYTRSLAGRSVPRWIGPSGLDSAVQPAFFANNVTMWLPGTGTTASISFGVSWTVATTQAHPAITNTNYMTQMRRATFTTTTTAANASGVRSTAPLCWRGNAAGLGGFFFAARFGILTYTSTMRVFVGLAAASGVMAGDPAAINDSIAMVKNTGSTTWQVQERNTANTLDTSVGRTTAAAGATDIFDFFAFCKPNDSKITVRVVDITTWTVLVDNVEKSTYLPTAGTMLYAHAECMNVTGGAGTAVAIFLNKLYIETDT